MESLATYWQDRALLEWQVELGADEAIGDKPIDRYALDAKPATAEPAAAETPDPQTPPTPAAAVKADPVADARTAADQAADLPSLAAALDTYPHCDLRRGAKSLVFSDGLVGARVMIVGEAPGRQEDVAGKPFVGQAGQLLDRMLAAIGLDRKSDDAATSVYITNVVPWRPPNNNTPDAATIAMMLPFLERHIALAAPDVLVLMGNTPCQALLGRAGITRMRGTWVDVLGRPALPMFHPAYLLRNTSAKREAWADLLNLKSKLRDTA